MQAIIIAAGESSRFWPLNQLHKSQVKILGNSLVFWTIKSLANQGIKNIIVIANPKNEKSLEEELGSKSKELGINLSFIVQEKPLGTGDAVFKACDIIKEPFFIFWPYKINAGEIAKVMLEKVEKEKAEGVLVGNETATPWDYGILKYEGEKVIEIVENPEPGKEPSKIKVAGAYYLEPDFFSCYKSLPKHHPEDFIDALNLYLRNKKTTFLIWEKELPALKYPWELLGIMKIIFNSGNFQNFISPKAMIGENVVLKGNVFIGDNVVIGDNTVIAGPCFIGENCQIGTNNVFRGPVNLEKGLKTGAFLEMKNCLVQQGSHFHSGYFGDSIIGENCRFGAGFITANRRIDRKNIKTIVKGKKIDTGLTYFGIAVGNESRFGIQVGTMPGVLVGSNCAVGPSSIVFENIEDNTKFFTEFKGVKKENK